MRPIERIDNFLTKVDWGKLEKRWEISNILVELSTKFTYTSYREFIDYWKENPDQRIGQVLINLGLIPDSFKIWNDEEFNILLDQGIAPEECLYWTSIYDKDGNLLEKPKARLIKELDSEHINNIYDHVYKGNGKLSTDYMTAFKNVLLSRNESIDHVQAIELMWNIL